MSDSEKCEHCGGRASRVGRYNCEKTVHPAPDLAQRIVLGIERHLRNRSGMSWNFLPNDMYYDLLDKLTEIVRKEIG